MNQFVKCKLCASVNYAQKLQFSKNSPCWDKNLQRNPQNALNHEFNQIRGHNDRRNYTGSKANDITPVKIHPLVLQKWIMNFFWMVVYTSMKQPDHIISIYKSRFQINLTENETIRNICGIKQADSTDFNNLYYTYHNLLSLFKYASLKWTLRCS